MELYIKLFEVLFPVFFIVGIGYFLGKKNPNFDTSFITTYSANFGTPSIVIFSISASGVTFAMFSEYFLYAVILLSSFLIVGLIFLILMKKDYLRELPTFFYLIQAIWVFQYAYLHMVNWVWVLRQLYLLWSFFFILLLIFF